LRWGSWRQGQDHRFAAQELTEEVHGRTPLLPAGPPHRHQDRLRPRARPGPAATPDLAQDDAEADRQLGPPVGRVQAWLTQEREQGIAMDPQVLGQALVGRVGLGREDQLGQLILRATASHGQAVSADLVRGVAVAQVQACPEQLGYPTRETDRSPRRGRRHLVGAPQQVHHPNAIAALRAILVIPYTSTARPYRPRRPSNS
jgi:hypothetical protein